MMKKFRIIVADDDQDDFNTIREAFQAVSRNYELEYLWNGKLLLDQLNLTAKEQQDLPHLILLDINMPKMDGIEALGKIKADPALCKIPVLMYSTSKNKAR
jgi:CheY-like chemotaxis protein